MSTPILLATLNARYPHAAFGLRYLYANLGELRRDARILEFTINENPRDIAERILAHSPRVVGFGVYIWNTAQTEQVVSLLKRLDPKLVIVLGGPEVSHEAEGQRICQLADFTLQGEADLLFAEFCRDYLRDGRLPASPRVLAPLPELRALASPYAEYTAEDIRNRIIYVEASRGCPYKCEYCLSSLDKSVRGFDLDGFLADLDRLIERGARQFKFIDRTFNLSAAISTRILAFFLERMHHGLFLHFELVPDRLPEELRALIRKFPPGALQFEVGIQTWNPEVAKLVSRRQDYGRIRDNFAFLKRETGVHLHADLIAGLPGETLASFAAGFDAVSALEPAEIQVGLLKRLKGTPIARHDREWEMRYQEHPPFQILATRDLDFATLQRLGRFAKFWDLYANSGNFRETKKLFDRLAEARPDRSRFGFFAEFSEFLTARHPHGHGIALPALVESAWTYLTEKLGVAPEAARDALVKDYALSAVKRDVPAFLRTGAAAGPATGARPATGERPSTGPLATSSVRPTPSALPRRQSRHHASPDAPAT